jgi:hypothetical protein
MKQYMSITVLKAVYYYFFSLANELWNHILEKLILQLYYFSSSEEGY